MSEAKTNHSQPGKIPGALLYIVDDEPMLLELATVILEPQGYRIETYRDPDVAFKHFSTAQPRPALLITDYAMHNLNGMQLIEKCRQLEPQQKILLISGTVGEDIFQGCPCRPDQFIAKPYQAGQLISAVKKLVGGS